MKTALSEILESPPVSEHKVKYINCDRGTENVSCAEFLKDNYGIKLIHNRNRLKASLAERILASIQRRLFRVLEWESSFAWVKYIDQVVNNHNKSSHRSLGFQGETPYSIVYDKQVHARVRRENAQKLVEFYQRNDRPPKFKISDQVRILNEQKQFQKSFSIPQWSDEIYVVTKVIRSIPPVFKIKPLEPVDAKTLQRSYNAPELSLVYCPQILTPEDLGISRVMVSDSANAPPEKPRYYVTQSRTVEAQRTRLGKAIGEDRTEYLLQDKNNPRFKQYIDGQTLINLKNAGSVDTSGLLHQPAV